MLPTITVNQLPRTRVFLLLRYTLILATAYLLLAEDGFSLSSTLAMLLVVVALASNVLLGRMPERMMHSMRFASGVILYDTLWITLALLSTGRFNSEFFFLYFFVLLLAAIGESLRLIVLGACVTCFAYLVGSSAMGVSWASLTSPSLIRIPFLFSAAIFYGYLVERTRREGRRADEAEALAEQLQRTLAEFRILYACAQEADRIKTEMLATVSHELRTPLTSSLGYVELLLDGSYGGINDEQRQALERVLSSNRILQHAISRMLDASRIEFGYEKLRCEEFDINDVFDDLRSEFVPPPPLTIRWPQASGIPPLRTDPDKLRAIMRNLVENAVKYTPQGLVTVEARWDAKRDEVEVCVSDTGIGIPAAEIDNIFEAFRQGSNRNLFGKAGVGLGLYIVQRLVQRLGGEIAVDSRLEQGSTFTARLPRLLHRGDAVAADEEGAGEWRLGAGEIAPSRPSSLAPRPSGMEGVG